MCSLFVIGQICANPLRHDRDQSAASLSILVGDDALALILFSFTFYRRCRWVLDLQPVMDRPER